MGQFLWDGLGWTGEQIIAGLEAVGYAAAEVGQFLWDGLGWTGEQIIAGLEAVGYAAAEVGQFLWDGLGWTGEQIIAGLEAVGYAAAEVGQFLWDGLGWTGEQILAGLEAVGYAVEDITDWLSDALSWGAEQIANALNTVLSWTEDAIGTILDGLGYTTDFIEDLLGDIFGTIICTELYRQGYLTDEIYAADVQFGQDIDRNLPLVRKGYQFLAAPIVGMMQESKAFTEAVYFFAEPWAEEMAHRTGVLEEDNFWGSLIMFVGVPLCFVVGIFVTLGYTSIALLLLLIGIIYAYKKGYLQDMARRVVYNNL